MKKISFIAVLTALVLGAFSLTSCVTDHDDLGYSKYFFEGFKSGFSQESSTWSGSWENEVSKVDDNTCKYEFEATEAMASSGVIVGLKTDGWGKRYEVDSATYAVGDTIPTVTSEPGTRGTVTVESGKTYVVTATHSAGVVTLKVTEKQ